MGILPLLAGHLAKIALLAVIAGILWRGRARLCWSFPLYVLAMLAGNVLVTFWPSRFFTPSFWVVKQGIYDVLKAAVVLELAWRGFSRFPGASRTARAVIPTLLTLGLLAASVYTTVWDWPPHAGTAFMWLLALAALVLMIVLYAVPAHEWQRAIMLGLAAYLLVFVALLGFLRRQGWTLAGRVDTVDTLAWLGLFMFWTWAAWRGEAAQRLAVPPGTPA